VSEVAGMNVVRTVRPSQEERAKTAHVIQVVEFILGTGRFAIDLFDVKEVVECTSITRLPSAPSFVKGIIDLRGEITTLIDLKQRLSIDETKDSEGDTRRIIVLDEAITRSKTGILVDDVSSVSTFESDAVDHTSVSFGGDEGAILGILKRPRKEKGRDENELIIWLNIRELLRHLEIGL